jgi:hypothetical protein
VNLTQLPSGTKHCGDTNILSSSMNFSVILFQFSKDYCLEKIPQEYPTRKINSRIKRGHWRKWKITMLSGFSVLRKIHPFFHAMHLIKYLLRKYQDSIIYGCTFFMRNKKIYSYPFLGKLGTLYSGI